MTQNRFTAFEKSSNNGNIVARPTNESTDEPVPLPGDLTDIDEEAQRGNWEQIVDYLTRHELGRELNLDDQGRGRISRERAVEALVDAEDSAVSGELSAHAYLEYLASDGVFDLTDDGDEVVVLKPFDELFDGDPSGLFNWAATLNTAIERIEAASDRVEDARERLDEHSKETQRPVETQSEIEEQLDEKRQELRRLLGGRSPSELDEREYDRFERLKNDVEMKKKTLRTAVEGLPEPDGENEMALSELIENFDNVKAVMESYRDEFRRRGVKKNIYPGDAVTQLNNLVNMLSAISNIDPSEEEYEDDDDFVDEFVRGNEENVSEASAEISEMDEGPREAFGTQTG